MQPQAQILPDGNRLHLQHGPIDLVIGAQGPRPEHRDQAFAAAQTRFATVLTELMPLLEALKQPVTPDTPRPPDTTAEGTSNRIAQTMHDAVLPAAGLIWTGLLGGETYVTRMAAVAGAVADTVLHAMCAATPALTKAYVNNGGDSAIHLAANQTFTAAMQDHMGRPLGTLSLTASDAIRGIATSGRHGRSLSLGIADSVTVLAHSAAAADVAATLIANAVDLPGHPGITRQPANTLVDDSDLTTLPVVTACQPLPPPARQQALAGGLARAEIFRQRGLIMGASLHFQGETVQTQCTALTLSKENRTYA